MIIRLGEIAIDLSLKDVQHVHLSVYPPNGAVKMTAPLHSNEESLKLYAISKLSWIKKEQKKFKDQTRETKRIYVERESIYLWGQRYLLTVTHAKRPSIKYDSFNLVFFCPEHYTLEQRRKYFNTWYRKQLRVFAEPLIMQWAETLQVGPNKLIVSTMKTKWGSCNPKNNNIRLNTELAKKPKLSIEYIIVHELLHLLEPNHGDRFMSLLEQHMPDWQSRKQMLSEMPLHFD